MSDLSDDEMHFKNVYEGMPKDTEAGDDDVNSIEDMDDSDSDSGDEKYKVIPKLTAEEIRCLKFSSWMDALTFYSSYAKSYGFVVRKDEVRRDAEKNVVMRQYVCNKAGLRESKYFTMARKRCHRPLTRTKCQAKFRIRLDYKTSEWKVVSFVEDHNHELTPSIYSHVIPAYRTLSESDRAQVDSLHSSGVRTCHIMGFMAAQKGGYSRVGFLKEDLYNYINRQKHYKLRGGDARAAISYLRGKADNDAMFYSKYTTSEDGKLKHVFWADGTSRADYQCFGDVLAFDATYGKTKYNHPLVIFSGSNHHSQTIIFGCALLVDETMESYKWLLETFLEAMSNKQPKSVVTDGDGAMREAIKQVFPSASHRLCAWHLHKNAKDNVKNKSFLTGFAKAMYYDFTIEEFEEFWNNLVAEHDLAGNRWVLRTYRKRRYWATAYLRDQFNAGIRTTSRCEAINCRIKPYVGKKNSIVEFMHNIEQAIRVYRLNELRADYKSLFTDNVLTTPLYKIESHASKVFTHEIFKEVRNQIEDVGGLDMMEKTVDGEVKTFKMHKYGRRDYVLNVRYNTTKNEFTCDCRRFTSRGIPCSHMFLAMRHENMESIPSSLICRRWRKDAKSEFMTSQTTDEVALEVMRTARYSSVAAACSDLCRIASDNGEFLREIMDDILKLTLKYKKKVGGHRRGSDGDKDIGDPDVIPGRGAPTKKRKTNTRVRCSNCLRRGHTKRTCTAKNGDKEELVVDDASEEEGKEKELTGGDYHSVQQTPDTTNKSISKSTANVKPRRGRGGKGKKQKLDSVTVKSEKDMPNVSVSSQHPEYKNDDAILSTQNSVKQMERIQVRNASILHGGTPHMVAPPHNIVVNPDGSTSIIQNRAPQMVPFLNNIVINPDGTTGIIQSGARQMVPVVGPQHHQILGSQSNVIVGNGPHSQGVPMQPVQSFYGVVPIMQQGTQTQGVLTQPAQSIYRVVPMMQHGTRSQGIPIQHIQPVQSFHGGGCHPNLLQQGINKKNT